MTKATERTVSAALKSKTNVIVKEWEEAVRNENPTARDKDRAALRDTLPEFLGEIATFVATDENHADKVIEKARQHGVQRAKQAGFTLDEVLAEYRILRRIIFRILEEEVPIKIEDHEKLLQAIDTGLVQAATEFATRRGPYAARLHNAETRASEAKGQLNASRRKLGELTFERSLRERFISALSHDLRTPLTVIKAGADLIARQAERPDLVTTLSLRISEACGRIDRMVRDLLDANRVEAGEAVTLKIEQCDLGTLTRKILDSMTTVHGSRFTLETEGNLEGYWSPDDLQRMIENLVVNGLKYGDPNGIVRVSLLGHPNTLSIAIHNQGNPIPPEQQAILFEPHKRLFAAQMSGRGGWGLGLTLVKGIVEAHGGQVSVISDPVRGTTFTVTFPRDSRVFGKIA